jgi:hypothetical protein
LNLAKKNAIWEVL